MKKIILAIFTIAIFGLACNKNKDLSYMPAKNTSHIKTRSSTGAFDFNGIHYRVENGILNFETFDEYENIVNADSREQLLEFANKVESSDLITNYYATVPSANQDQYEFVGKLLNKDGFIKIDEYLILIDFTSSKVYAQKDGNTSDILSAKNGGIQQEVITMAIEEDVIEELKIYKTRGLFCNDAWQSSIEKFPINGALPTNLTSVQQTSGGTITMAVFINTSVKYWPAGIYFELNSRVVVTPAGNPLATAPYTYTTNYSCKRRCGNSFSGTSTHTCNNNNDKNIMYWNTRALRQGFTFISSTVSSPVSVPTGATRTASF